MPFLSEAMQIKARRMCGEVGELSIAGGTLVHKEWLKDFTLYDLRDNRSLIDAWAEARESEESDTRSDYGFLSEILLRSLSFFVAPNARINQRLNFFCLETLLLDDRSKEEDLLRFFLLFNPCSDDFVEKFTLRAGRLHYNGQPVDLPLLYSQDAAPPSLASAGDLLREWAEAAFGDRALPRQIFRKKPDDLTPAELRSFYLSLGKAAENFRLSSWDSPGANVSLYYGIHTDDRIQDRTGLPAGDLRYRAERLIDEYAFHYADDPSELERMIRFFSAEKAEKILAHLLDILFCHPFLVYRRKARDRIADSNLHGLMPSGFAKDKLIKFQRL